MNLADHAGVAWLALAAMLGILELIIPGVFVIFVGIGAAITGATVLALPMLGLGGQLASLAAWSAVALGIGRRWYRDFPIITSDPLLNDRAARLAGQIVTVSEAIEDGRGRVRVGDSEWPAEGADAATGTQLRIADCKAGIVRVEPL